MQMTDVLPESSAVDLARECLYRFLSGLVAGPYDERWRRVQDAENQVLAQRAVDLLRHEPEQDRGLLAFGERSLEDLEIGDLLDELQKSISELRADYDRVFGLVIPKECPPYETEYHPSTDTFFRSQEMADIAGFYRAFGIEPARALPERPDYLALELEFMAFLLMKKRLALASLETNPDACEQASVCEQVEQRFFGDHIAWWVPAFATGLERKAMSGYNRILARLLAALVAAERHRLAIPPPQKPVQAELIERPEEQTGCSSCLLRA
jgi:putative dimethyl sulfoxide reductase chaperone